MNLLRDIETFLLKDSTTTPGFARLSAYAAVAAATASESFVRILPGENRKIPLRLYCWLVGSPASGKSEAIDPIHGLLKGLGSVKIAPNTATGKGLIDFMAQEGNNKCYFSFRELAQLAQDQIFSLASTLVDLYGSSEYLEQTRAMQGKMLSIKSPRLTCLLGGQEMVWMNVINSRTIDNGLLSRLLVVYEPDQLRLTLGDLPPHLHTTPKNSWEMFDRFSLVEGLEGVAKVKREVVWKPATYKTFSLWNNTMIKVPSKMNEMVSWDARKPLHLAVLCALEALSSLKFEILPEHFERALESLNLFEENLLNLMGLTKTSELFKNLQRAFLRHEGKTVSDQWLKKKLLEVFEDPSKIPSVMQTMIEGGIIVSMGAYRWKIVGVRHEIA